jgi:hypothetical protein
MRLKCLGPAMSVPFRQSLTTGCPKFVRRIAKVLQDRLDEINKDISLR